MLGLAFGAGENKHRARDLVLIIRRQLADCFEGFFEQLGIQPARPWALATGLTEAVAGALTMLGIGTRVAALGVLVTQGVAIAKVHGKKGFAIEKQGFEFNLALCAMALGLLLTGPGRMSVHHYARRQARRRELRRLRFFPKQRTMTRALEWLA